MLYLDSAVVDVVFEQNQQTTAPNLKFLKKKCQLNVESVQVKVLKQMVSLSCSFSVDSADSQS